MDPELSEVGLGVRRVRALLEATEMLYALTCTTEAHRDAAVFELACLGWTPDAFIHEAFGCVPGDGCDD